MNTWPRQRATSYIAWAVLGLAWLVIGSAASAQTVWRCGAQGNSFSDRPCADGQALAKAPPPTAQAVQQAAEVARREALLAQRWRAERLAQEQDFLRARAAAQGPPDQAAKSRSAQAKAARPKPAGDNSHQAPRLRVARAADFSREARPVRRPAPAVARTSATAAHGSPPIRD